MGTNETAEQHLLDAGYEDVVVFQDPSFDEALIGVSSDNCAIYSYEKMVTWLMEHDGMTEEDAVDWIDFNTIRSLPYAGEKAPIVMFELS